MVLWSPTKGRSGGMQRIRKGKGKRKEIRRRIKKGWVRGERGGADKGR